MSHAVLITGGAGFLGSHLCDRLIEAGARVTCVDNFFTGVRANVAHLLDRPEFTLIEHDVIEPLDAVWVGPIDRIYNLACPASPPHYQYDPVFTMRTSVLGALNMLELAHLTGARILQASTSEVYGDPEEHPQRESYRGCVNPIGPRACYDEGKRAAETLFFDYRRTRGVDIRVARIFNTYGPRMHPFDGRVVSNFVRQALAGEDLTIYGDGAQTRSFCYVDDLVDGLIRLMESEPKDAGSGRSEEPDRGDARTGSQGINASSGGDGRDARPTDQGDSGAERTTQRAVPPGEAERTVQSDVPPREAHSSESGATRRGAGETSVPRDFDLAGPVNLGNPGEFTVRELADLVLELTGSKSKIVTRPLPQDDPKQRRPDISLAKRRLGWRPSVELREGLERTIDWFRSIDVSGYSPPTPAG